MWDYLLVGPAEKQLKKYRKSQEYIKFKKAIQELTYSSDPTELGERKDIAGVSYLCYDVTHSLRLLYNVDTKKNLIIIFGLGDHKDVYGKD